MAYCGEQTDTFRICSVTFADSTSTIVFLTTPDCPLGVKITSIVSGLYFHTLQVWIICSRYWSGSSGDQLLEYNPTQFVKLHRINSNSATGEPSYFAPHVLYKRDVFDRTVPQVLGWEKRVYHRGAQFWFQFKLATSKRGVDSIA